MIIIGSANKKLQNLKAFHAEVIGMKKNDI